MNVSRRTSRRLLVVVALASLWLLAAASSASAGAISGRVTTAAGAPVGGSRVDALQVMGGGIYELRASAFVSKTDGSYLIDGLPAGTYVVRFQGNATYMRELYDDVPNRSLATPLVLAASGTIGGIDAVLVPYPKLRGTVTSTSGAPIAGARVTVLTSFGDVAGVTAADGSFAFTVNDDQAGVLTYKIRFDDPLGAYLTQWYDGKGSQESADKLALPPGSTTTVSARLVLAGFISGRLTDQDGDPLAGARLQIRTFDSAFVQGLGTAADGTYRSAGLAPGDYEVNFGGSLYLSQEYYDDQTEFADRDLVTVVGGATTSGIDAVLQQGGAIAGRVTDAGGQSVRGTHVQLYTSTGTLVASSIGTWDDGLYSFGRLQPGSYKVRFEPGRGGRTAQWYAFKGTMASADAVTVTKGATTGGVDARLGAGARIVGTVSAPGGLDGAVTVKLFDADGRAAGVMETRADGSYAFEGVPPGAYRLQFQPDTTSDLRAEYNHDKPTLDTADPVAITGTETVTVDARLEIGKAIVGHVIRTDGQPVPAVAIIVYDASGARVGFASTDSAGNYRVGGLATGDYRVHFGAPGSPVDVDYNGDVPPDAGYLESEFYDDKHSLETATPVSVSAQTTRVNDQLASTGSIWGTVRTADGAALKGARVFLVRDDGRRAGPFLTTWKGQYRAELLRPGRWKLFFASPYTAYAGSYYDDKATLARADAVTVVDHVTLTGIDAALVRQPSLLDDSVPFALSGR